MIRDASVDDEPAVGELSRMAFEELRRIYRPSELASSSLAGCAPSFGRIEDPRLGREQLAILPSAT